MTTRTLATLASAAVSTTLATLGTVAVTLDSTRHGYDWWVVPALTASLCTVGVSLGALASYLAEEVVTRR